MIQFRLIVNYDPPEQPTHVCRDGEPFVFSFEDIADELFDAHDADHADRLAVRMVYDHVGVRPTCPCGAFKLPHDWPASVTVYAVPTSPRHADPVTAKRWEAVRSALEDATEHDPNVSVPPGGRIDEYSWGYTVQTEHGVPRDAIT